jgi:hypothetical protein
MEISPGDLVDRLSILTLKSERLPPNAEVRREYVAIRNACEDAGISSAAFEKLFEVNGKIWDLESDIRKGRENTLELSSDVKVMDFDKLRQLAEVGRRALMIRDLNGKRVELKNTLNTRLGGFIEVKGDHASAQIPA